MIPTLRLWEDMTADAAFAWRGLRRNRRFALSAVVTLALGIGASTAAFSLVNAVLVRPLPFADPQSLYAIWQYIPGFQGEASIPPRAKDFVEWRKSDTPFAELAALAPARFDWIDGDEPERLGGARVSTHFFDLLGVPMRVGRAFLAEEGARGRDSSVVISHTLWVRRFAQDPDVTRRTMRLDGQVVQIVGVLPPSFTFPAKGQVHPLLDFTTDVDVWKPLVIGPAEIGAIASFEYAVIGRLQADATEAQAADALGLISRRLMKKDFGGAGPFGDVRTRLSSFREIYVGQARRGLLMLLAAAGLLLIISLVAVTHLVLARLTDRRSEIAVRLAMGARTTRLARQFMTETMVLALLGAALGGIVAYWALAAVMARAPAELLPLGGVRVDATVLTFAIVLTLSTSIAVGLLPLFSLHRDPIAPRLRQEVAPAAAPGRRGWLRSTLIGAQVALTSVVLFVSVLLLHSYVRIVNVDVGFRSEGILAVDLALPDAAGAGRLTTFYGDVIGRLEGMPGVAAAAAVSALPLTEVTSANPVLLDGDNPIEMALERPVAIHRHVSPGYFETMGIALAAGRLFRDGEPEIAAIVSVSLARALWPGQPPAYAVGQRVKSAEGQRARVVGVVADVAEGALGEPGLPQIYRLYSQDPVPAMTVVMRTTGDAAPLAPSVRAAIRQMAPDLPIPLMKTMSDVALDSILLRRFQLALVLVFASAGLILTLAGIYGIVGYSVAQRTKEIGLRVACGALPREIVRLVLVQGLRPVAIGLLIGIPAATAMGGVLRSLVYGVGILDPASVIGTSLLIVLTAAAACYIPARRAAGIDSIAALRTD